MKLQVLQEDLQKALSLASRFTSARAQLPVLANILLNAKTNKLSISATNLENAVLVSIGANISEEGEVTIPARVITELISNLNKGQLTLVTDKELLTISSEGFSSTISGMNASDFPNIPQKISKDALSIGRNVLTDALTQVLVATSTDETRPLLTGVYFRFKEGEITLVATDGFRLSEKKMNIESKALVGDVIIPKGILVEVSRLDMGENINYSYKESESQAVFKADSVLLSSRVLEGSFPDYEKIIPSNSEMSVSVDKKDLLQAVKSASVFARDSSNVIRMKIMKKGLGVSSESQTTGKQNMVIDAKVEGDVSKEMEIAFNYRFIEDVLGVMKGESVDLGFTNPNAPGVFKDPTDSNFLHLIMPVKISE